MQQKIFSLLTKGENERKTKLSVDVSGLEDFVKAMDGLDKDWNNTKINKRIEVIGQTMSDCSEQAKKYAREMTSAADGTDAYVQSQSLANVVGNKFIGVLKGIGVAMMDSLITFAATAALNYVVGQIMDVVNRENDLREAAQEAGNELNNQISSINDYKTQISTLKESIDSGTLSEQEAYDVRKQLIDIQDSLVEKYGDEAAGIDLVNGKLDEQIAKLDDIADRKAKNYLASNSESISTAQKKMTDDLYLNPGNMYEVGETQAMKLQEIAAKYADQGLTMRMSGAGMFDKSGSRRIEFNISANATDAEQTLSDFMSDIAKVEDQTHFLSSDLYETLKNGLSTGVQDAQDVINTWGSEAETAAKYQIQLSDSWSELYKNLEDAQSEYNEAVIKGDDEAIAAAIQKAKEARNALDDSNSFDLTQYKDRYVKQYMQAQADELEASTKLKSAQMGLSEALGIYADNAKIAKDAVNGLTDAEKKYGNIDNVNRALITWTDENRQKYSKELKSWSNEFGDLQKDLAGSWSTVLGDVGSTSDYGSSKNKLSFAYTLFMQEGNELVPLTKENFGAYMEKVVAGATDASGEIDPDRMLKLDADGFDMEIDGQVKHVQNMLAAVQGATEDGLVTTLGDVYAIAGTDADELERMGLSSEYAGRGMHQLHENTRQLAALLDDPDSFGITETLAEYLDIDEDSARNLFDTIISGLDDINGMDDLDILDIEKLRDANGDLSAYTDTQIKGFDELKQAADTCGLSISDFVDLLVNAGLVVGENIKYTNDFTSNAISTATAVNKAIGLVNTALQSQSTAAGVAADSYSELIKEDGDYAAALEYSGGYMKLNYERAKEITQAKQEEAAANIKVAYSQNQMKYSKVQTEMAATNKILEENADLTEDDRKKLEDYNKTLEQQSKQLRDNCNSLKMQYSALMQASSAYQAWLDSQNMTESDEMYNNAIKARDAIATGLKNGQVGTYQYKAAVDFMVPEEFQNDVQTYIKKLNRYFQQATDGSVSGTGLNNFITDAITKGLMSKDADGKIQIAANKTVTEFADALKLTNDDVQSIFGALETYGWEFDWDNLLGDPIEELRMKIDDIKDMMEDLGPDAEGSAEWEMLNEELDKYNSKLEKVRGTLTSQDVDSAISDITERVIENGGLLDQAAQDTINEFGRVQNLVDLQNAKDEYDDLMHEMADNPLSVDTSRLTELSQTIGECEQKKEQLGEPTAIEIQAYIDDKANGDLEKAKEISEDLQKAGILKIDADTTAVGNAQKEVDTLTDSASNITMTLNTSSAIKSINTVQTQLNSMNTEIPITLKFGVSGTILSGMSGIITRTRRQAKAAGGISGGGRTLVGELGSELVVDPHNGSWETVGENGAEFVNLPKDAIVFDHKKTRKLLGGENAGGRGRALALGNDSGISGGGYMIGQNPATSKTYKATTASTKATKDNSKALEENKKALEKQKTALEKQKTALEKESNKLKIYGQAALNEIEKRVKALNKEKEAQDKAFEAEIDHLNEIKDAKDKELDATTKRIKEEKEAKDKAWEKEKKQLEEKKEALQDANDEEDRAIKLAELKDALAKAQANRTVRIYNRNQGFIWAADQQAVNDAQTALDDQMRDWKREDVIKAVENEIDAIDKLKDAYDEETENRLDDLDKEKDAFDEKIEAEIEEINKRKDAYDEAIEAEIEKLDDLKDQWNEVMSLIGTSWEDYQLGLEAAAHFSDMSFEGMTDDLIGYKDDVLANMEEIGGVTDQIDSITESIEKLEEAISDAKDAASGGSSGSGGSSALGLGVDGAATGNDGSESTVSDNDWLQKLRDSLQEVSEEQEHLNQLQDEAADKMNNATGSFNEYCDASREFAEAQRNATSNYDLMIDKSEFYVKAIQRQTDMTQEAKDKEIASLVNLFGEHESTYGAMTSTIDAYIGELINSTDITAEELAASSEAIYEMAEQHNISYEEINSVLQGHIDAVLNDTESTEEQRQLQIENLSNFVQTYGTSYDTVQGFLENYALCLAQHTDMSAEQRAIQLENLSAFCEQYGISYDGIIAKLLETSGKMEEQGQKVSAIYPAMQRTIVTALQVAGGSYDELRLKIAAVTEEHQRMMQAVANADFSVAMPMGTATNHGNKIQWNSNNFDPFTHATGVLNAATTHIAITDEKGPEIKMRKPSSGQYSLIEKGSSVIPAQPSANLWKFGLDPDSFIAAHMGQRSIKSVEITQPDVGSGVTVSVGDIQMYGVNDVESFGRVIHDRVSGIFAQEFSKR